MERDSIDLGKVEVGRLFRLYFIPTLLGMISLCAVTATDGIFVGQGVGSEGLAAVNICMPPCMLIMGLGLMLGVGCSVVASIHMAENNIKAARLNVTQALGIATLIVSLFLIISLISPSATGRLLGSSETLMPLVTDYLPWIFCCTLFQIWGAIGLFVVRLDGAPKFAMWCNIIPGILNVILDYVMIFPLGLGVKGAGIATLLSCFVGGMMVMGYLLFFARDLRLKKLKASMKSLRLTLRNIGYQCKIGISALLGEATMGLLMLMGNLMFMIYLGDDGVGAFSIACYYSPFAFMIGNAIAQSAQPIISYNFGLGAMDRVVRTEKLAILSALVCGLSVTAMFVFMPNLLVELFIDPSTASGEIAVNGFPWYSAALVFFVFNLTAIGYFQSVKNVSASIVFALLRGVVFLIPSFIVMPVLFGTRGLWLALFLSEFLTTVSIIGYYIVKRGKRL